MLHLGWKWLLQSNIAESHAPTWFENSQDFAKDSQFVGNEIDHAVADDAIDGVVSERQAIAYRRSSIILRKKSSQFCHELLQLLEGLLVDAVAHARSVDLPLTRGFMSRWSRRIARVDAGMVRNHIIEPDRQHRR